MAWTLTIGGVAKSFEAWGASNPYLVLRSLDADELTFTVAGDALAAAEFSYGQTVSVARDGVTRFTGTITAVRAFGDRLGAGWRVSASGPWWQLARTLYQQELASYDGGCAFAPALKTTKVVLFQDALSGQAINTAQQILAALTWAAQCGVSAALGQTPAALSLPFETVRELTVADVIRRCLQPTPDAVSWFDYSGAAPVLHCAQRDTLAAASLDFESSPATIEEFELQRRDDLVPAGVRFNYVGMGRCATRVPQFCRDETTGVLRTDPGIGAAGAEQQTMTVTQDFAGNPDAPGGVIGTIDLAQLTESTTETAPIGLAAQYYAALLNPQWAGLVVTRARECAGTVRPGMVLNLANGNPAWSTMRALVQEVREELRTGRTAITVGPPAHLVPQDFVALVQWTRRRALVQDAFPVVRPPGTSETPNCDAGKDPRAKDLLDKLKGNGAAAAQQIESGAGMQIIELEVCNDGVAGTVKVYAPTTQ